MSKTHELLRAAEASYQGNNRDGNGYENIELCLNELNLSHNQIMSQNYDALMDSYIQINTVIANPYKCLNLQEGNQTSLNAGLSDFLARRRLEIIERIDKILKRYVFNKINELTVKIEDKNVYDKINQRVKQLEFLVFNKRSNWIDCLKPEQIISDFGKSQNDQPPAPQSNLEKADLAQKENMAVRSIISRIFHRSKK